MANENEEFNEIVQQILGTNSNDQSLSLTDKHSIDKALLNMFIGTVVIYSTQPNFNLGIATIRALNWMQSFMESHATQKNAATQYMATQFAQFKKDTLKRLMTNKKQSDLPLGAEKCAKYFAQANTLINDARSILVPVLVKYKKRQEQSAITQIISAINQRQRENGR